MPKGPIPSITILEAEPGNWLLAVRAYAPATTGEFTVVVEPIEAMRLTDAAAEVGHLDELTSLVATAQSPAEASGDTRSCRLRGNVQAAATGAVAIIDCECPDRGAQLVQLRSLPWRSRCPTGFRRYRRPTPHRIGPGGEQHRLFTSSASASADLGFRTLRSTTPTAAMASTRAFRPHGHPSEILRSRRQARRRG